MFFILSDNLFKAKHDIHVFLANIFAESFPVLHAKFLYSYFLFIYINGYNITLATGYVFSKC